MPQIQFPEGSTAITPVLSFIFDNGLDTPEVSSQLGIKLDTLSKAVRAGRFHKPAKKRCHWVKQQKRT